VASTAAAASAAAFAATTSSALSVYISALHTRGRAKINLNIIVFAIVKHVASQSCNTPMARHIFL
jgi:hypothetical protein